MWSLQVLGHTSTFITFCTTEANGRNINTFHAWNTHVQRRHLQTHTHTEEIVAFPASSTVNVTYLGVDNHQLCLSCDEASVALVNGTTRVSVEEMFTGGLFLWPVGYPLSVNDGSCMDASGNCESNYGCSVSCSKQGQLLGLTWHSSERDGLWLRWACLWWERCGNAGGHVNGLHLRRRTQTSPQLSWLLRPWLRRANAASVTKSKSCWAWFWFLCVGGCCKWETDCGECSWWSKRLWLLVPQVERAG